MIDPDFVIETRQLTCYYGRRVGVRSLDLRIPAGQVFGFLGPNGAGKTTAIRLLLGFLRDTGGATIFGHDCWRQRAVVQRDVGYLPGDLRLYPWMTGHRALRISGQIRRLDLSAAGRELRRRFRLEMNLRVRKMSRGMRQKLGLILASAHRPRLLILDEPTSGLDPLMQDVLMDLLRERTAEGTTVFFSSHTLSEVEQLCDHIAIVRDGEVVVDDALDVWRRKAGREITLVFSDETAARAAGSRISHARRAVRSALARRTHRPTARADPMGGRPAAGRPGAWPPDAGEPVSDLLSRAGGDSLMRGMLLKILHEVWLPTLLFGGDYSSSRPS